MWGIGGLVCMEFAAIVCYIGKYLRLDRVIKDLTCGN